MIIYDYTFMFYGSNSCFPTAVEWATKRLATKLTEFPESSGTTILLLQSVFATFSDVLIFKLICTVDESREQDIKVVLASYSKMLLQIGYTVYLDLSTLNCVNH